MSEKSGKPRRTPEPPRHAKRRADANSTGVDGFADDYLTAIAHDLRGSLNSIVGWAELIERKALDEAGRARAGEIIIRQARQQLELINELVDTWRLLSGNLQLKLTPLDVREVIHSAVDAAQPHASGRGVRFDVHLDPMPAPLLADATRLRQALTVLCSNVSHFAPDGGTVHVRLSSARGMAELTVQDPGSDIDKVTLPHLFNRQRPPNPGKDSSRARFGRGLSIVRDLIDLHGGSIKAEGGGSVPGVTFRVSLPLDNARIGRPDVHLAAGVSTRLAGLSVLVVDDDSDAREVVAAILRHYGASVLPARSASSALAILRREHVDVIVADLGMPVQDGYDLIRQVRTLDQEPAAHVPAAALTAYTSEEDRERALSAGFQAHLSKPVDSALLVATVERLSSSSQPM